MLLRTLLICSLLASGFVPEIKIPGNQMQSSFGRHIFYIFRVRRTPVFLAGDFNLRYKGRVKTGLDTLIESDFAALRGKRIGLITHRAGVTANGEAAIDVLANAPGITLAALFAPEHGIRGTAEAGVRVSDTKDEKTGLPIYSLYGKTRKPTARMLRGLDGLVYDLQDTGVRSYTYISTLGLCMEAAAEQNLAFYVLDRPNPLGGERIEGNIPTTAFRSFVGRYPLPYLYGLTPGELAQMLNGEGWLSGKRRCRLTVIPMQGWQRSMTWEATGLRWTPTSPNVPKAESPHYLAATGIAGELSTLDVGVRTAEPFQVVGAPDFSAKRLTEELSGRNLPGVAFSPISYIAKHGAYRGKQCHGVRITFTDLSAAQLTRVNFEILDAIRRCYSGRPLFNSARAQMFDLVCGTDAVRKNLLAGKPAQALWTAWNRQNTAFHARRNSYLLYP